jgi:hypothetical protein
MAIDEYGALDIHDITPSNFYNQLAKAEDINEVKRLHDMAAALEKYARSINMTIEEINRASEARIWSEYKAGKILLEMERSPGIRTDLTYTHDVKRFKHQIEELGINRMAAHRWQLLARLPEDELRNFINKTRATDRLTSAAALREARQFNSHLKQWDQPKLDRNDFDGMSDGLFLAVLCNAIRDSASGEYGDEPKEWILQGLVQEDEPGDCKIFCEKYGLPFDTICDWVLSGCSTKPTHEVLIDMITDRYEAIKEGG